MDLQERVRLKKADRSELDEQLGAVAGALDEINGEAV